MEAVAAAAEAAVVAAVVAAAEVEAAAEVAIDITAYLGGTASTVNLLLSKNSPSPNPLLMN